MTIQTPFNIGDSVYLMHENRIIQVPIKGINITVSRGCPFINRDCVQFTFDCVGNRPSTENEIFRTKQELLQHLAKYSLSSI